MSPIGGGVMKLERNINSSWSKYNLESNVWDIFILGGLHKKSGVHSYLEKMHMDVPNKV